MCESISLFLHEREEREKREKRSTYVGTRFDRPFIYYREKTGSPFHVRIHILEHAPALGYIHSMYIRQKNKCTIRDICICTTLYIRIHVRNVPGAHIRAHFLIIVTVTVVYVLQIKLILISLISTLHYNFL